MIRFEGVVKKFAGREVLAGVDLEVRKGELLAVVGPSGTGKSVLLKHVVGLLAPTAGRVWVDGVEVSRAGAADLARVRSRVGYLFQGGALLGWLTVAENVALPLRESAGARFTEDEINRRVTDALAQVELSDAADRHPAEISGGMIKRAALARAIVRDVDVMLYDEPTSGLDPVTAAHVNDLVRRLGRARGLTSVLVTHDLAGALLVADRVLMLKDGHVVLCAAPADFARSENAAVRAFLDAQFIAPDFLERGKL